VAEDLGEEIEDREPNILSVHYQLITRNQKGDLRTVKQNKKYRFSYNKGDFACFSPKISLF
jgi:hypothetical protein